MFGEVNIASRRSLHNHGNTATERNPTLALCPNLISNDFIVVLYSAQYHRQHYVLHAFEQFGALYMHNHDDKYPARPGFEPGTLGYKPQSIRMSNQSRAKWVTI